MISAPPGFFGKVPARGDFIGRRLAPALAASWDAWLGRLTISVRDAAGDTWPESWLTAPLWQFALGSDLAPAPGAAGILIASVDRVGRMFPFTIIGPAAGIPDDIWFESAEALALDALDDDFNPDTLDSALVQLGPPPPGATLAPGQSLWRSRGSDRVNPVSTLITGLPNRQDSAAMVLG
jgi:type VI secretion system protein ImpM